MYPGGNLLKKLLLFGISVLAFTGLNTGISFADELESTPEQVIISFEDNIDYQALEEMGAEITEEFPSISAVSATLPEGMPIQAASADSSIEYVEENAIVRAAAQQTTWGYQKIKANTATSLGYTGKGVKIAIVDSGINSKHPDLKVAGGMSKVGTTSPYSDQNGHGTHVAGIIGAQNNTIGTVGVAPNASLYSVKVLSGEGIGTLEGVIAGIQWSIDQKVDIINLSLTTENKSPALEAIMKKAYNAGIIIVAASGNEGMDPLFKDALYPAAFGSVIAVGSVSDQNKLSYFSNYGPSQELVAPGENIWSTFANKDTLTQEDYAYSEGTSVATPFVAGTFAQYKEAYPHLSNSQLRETVKRAAVDLGTKGRDNKFGYGLVQSLKTKAAFFPDMVIGSWYTVPVQTIYTKGIIKGFPDGTYRPQATITRAEAITMVGRALKWDSTTKPHVFTDVKKDSYAAAYINHAFDLGFISGFPDGSFRPNAPITRGDMAVVMQAAFKLTGQGQTAFTDVPVDMYYYDAIQKAYASKVVKGYNDNTFRPRNSITRAENAEVINNALK